MLMTSEEVKKLELYLKAKSLERHKEIEEYEKIKSPNFKPKQMRKENFYQLSHEDAIPNSE